MQELIDVQEFVETLREDQLTDLLVAVASELVELSGMWCEKAQVEIAGGADEFVPVLENSREFYNKATELAQAAMDLDAFSAEIGAF